MCASVAVAIALSTCSMSIVRVLFERGRFGSELAKAVAHIQSVLIWYLPPALVTQVLNQFVWAIGRNRTLMWISAAMLLLKLAIGAPAAHFFGIEGLAWSQVGIYWLIATAILLLATLYSRGAPAGIA
jgi:peptidoglycan biosynthesis protein MviN/MurJ (putative lipid II flippase)